jgi:predicted RNA-binding Zn ribbon-like protein
MGTRTKQSHGHGRVDGLPRLLGGALCFHLVNSIEGPLSDGPVDTMTSYADLVTWGIHTGVLTDAEAAALREAATLRPAEAVRTFARATTLRQAIYATFRAVAMHEPVPEGALAKLRKEYVAALTQARLTADGWTYDDTDRLDRPLWPVVRSAVELLTDGDHARIKQCQGAGDCGWLFYDTSRNGKRRWCSMEGCGSRVKMRRHYASHRAAD